MQMFNWDNVTVRHEPFTVFFIRDLLSPVFYRELAETFPLLSSFRYRERLGNKYLLTELEGEPYYDFVTAHPAWQRFHDEIKSINFKQQVLSFLRLHNGALINDAQCSPCLLGEQNQENHHGGTENTERYLADNLISRFEFSALPTNGGSQRPHTDSPRKVVSLVISLMKEGEWNPEWGGGTSICKPKDERLFSNYSNNYLDFKDVEVIDTFPFVPNGCVMFAKTDVSWHCVKPINLPESAPLRKTVAVSLYHESDD